MRQFVRNLISLSWVFLLILELSSCQLVPLPVDLGHTLGDFREGSYSFELPASFENLNATFYLPDDQGYPVDFEPPSTPPTFANARFRVRYVVDGPGITGSMYLTPYFAPTTADVFAPQYALGNPVGLIVDGTEHVLAGEASLTSEQLDLLKSGHALLGIRLDVVNLDAPNGSGTEVTFTWKFEELVTEVGLF